MQDGSDMSVGFIALNLEGIFDGLDGGASFGEDFNLFSEVFGEPGDIGDGEFDGFSIHPFGLSDEVGGFGVSVGDLLDVHGQESLFVCVQKHQI